MLATEFESEMKWFLEFYDKIFRNSETMVWFEIFKSYTVKSFHTALIEHIAQDGQPFFPAIGKITMRIKPEYIYTPGKTPGTVHAIQRDGANG